MDANEQKIRDYIKAERFNGNELDLGDYDTVYRSLYDVASNCDLDVDFDFVDTGSDCYIYATCYVPNMISDGQWYNVIVDVDVKADYDNDEQFIEELVRLDNRAKRILSHFKK